MSTHLLLNERPLQVLPTLAAIFGINEAIAIQQIHWVITIKHEHQDDKTFHEGFMWCKYTLIQWGEKMPWLSGSSIYRLFKKLENEGIIKTIQPYASSRDQTKWYRIDYDVFNVKSQIPSSQNDDLSCSHFDQIRVSQNDYMINTLKDLKNLNKKQKSQKTENPSLESNLEDFDFIDPLVDQFPTPPLRAAPPAQRFVDPYQRAMDVRKRKPEIDKMISSQEFLKFLIPILKRSEYYKVSCDVSDSKKWARIALEPKNDKCDSRWDEVRDRYQDFLESQSRSQQHQQAIATPELVASPPPAHIREKFKTA